MVSRAWGVLHQVLPSISNQVTDPHRLRDRVDRNPDAPSQRATWTLHNVLRRCPQPQRRRHKRITHFPSGEQLKYVLQIHYKASNNGAEYEALIHGLHIAVSLGIKWLLAFGDSKVVIEQVNKEWGYVKDTMDAYCAEIRKVEGHFEGIEFQHVPRNNNMAADVLSKLGSRQALVPAGVFVQDLHKPSIKLLNPDNPEPLQQDQTSAPPRDMLMS
jgi:ribonuclease HI